MSILLMSQLPSWTAPLPPTWAARACRCASVSTVLENYVFPFDCLCFTVAAARPEHARPICPRPPSIQRRLGEIERLEAKATAILDEVAQRTGVGEAAESLWAK